MAKKYLLVLCILLFTVLRVFSQSNCEPNKFKELISYTKKSTLTSSEFLNSLEVLKNLESNHCGDFIVRKHGVDSVIASLTSLFGRICLIYNTQEAVKEYLRYMQRHQGSAEEEISFSFERLFEQQPEYILATIGYNEDLLNQLGWGFANNHYKNPQLNISNYKTLFYRFNPKIRAIYPKYKKQIDYLLNDILAEIKE